MAQQPLEDPAGDEPDADVIPFKRDTSYEHALDDDDTDAVPVHQGRGIELPRIGGERRKIIPAQYRTWKAARKHLGGRSADAGHHVAFHGIRSLWYLLQGTWWAVVGLFKIADRQRRWWWLPEHGVLVSMAVLDNNSKEYRALTSHVRKIRGQRGTVIGLEAAVILLFTVVMLDYSPWWGWAVLGVALLPPLARTGRPAHLPIITPSMTTPRIRVISGDVILRALYVAKLGDPVKPDQQITFGSPVSRNGDGCRVVVDLPYGKHFGDVMKALQVIASGLDVKASQVYPSPDRTSERRVILWIADTDPLAVPAGPTPLLNLKRRSIWKPAPFGLDERGNPVAFGLLWVSILIGAQPRKGKTFSARLLALYAALDPYVKLTVIDGKASPDWVAFRLVAHRIIFGTHPTRDGDPVEQVLDALREIKKHIQDANEFLRTLPLAECPEGKITEELSHKYAELRVWMLVMEEFQVYYELDEQKKSAEIASLLSFIIAVGPSVGVILLSASQKPGSVGAGDVGRLFTRFRDNHVIRFALKCGSRIVSEAVLGTEAYQEGYDASALDPRYKGVGILREAFDHTPVVRCHFADGADAEKILQTARQYRDQARTLTGMATGEELDKPGRDVLADVLAMFGGSESSLKWAMLAERLADRIPERWDGATADAVSAQLRDLGVPSAVVKAPPPAARGCRKAAVEQAMGMK
jgi:DNA segregation ATPase FtsK/SpoIIIE, S-DNA-T family